jgi:hypothetical protein
MDHRWKKNTNMLPSEKKDIHVLKYTQKDVGVQNTKI